MQNYETGKKYHGFILTRSEFRADMNSDLLMFEHEKTGARVVAVKNDDDNKTFCVAFRTIPEDCTGVAHILEHSVLSGSEKYPVKDVFSELYKGGLSTFMNAFTFPDATYYPFSTRNLKEYFNFMSVYLDTTFRPLLKKNTFLQEGWHYEVRDEDSPMEYQGIVYNEMKGAMSNPISQLSQNISKTLLPCSTYSFNSGGDPEKITDLSYEYFLNFHKKYYHPSNSLTYIYGNADLDEELRFINDNYFSLYERSTDLPSIACSVGIEPMRSEVFRYYAGDKEDLKNKSYISVSTKICNPGDVKLNISMHLISNILFNSEASPLKIAVIRSGIAEDFSGWYDDYQFETALTSFISGTEKDKKEEFLKIYFDTLKELIEKGIDKELILSELDNMEYKQKEKEISALRGLIYMYKVMYLGLYGIEISDNLNTAPVLSSIRKEVEEGPYVENIIKKYLFDKNNTAVVIMEPDPKDAEKKYKREKDKLDGFKNSLGRDKIREMVDSNKDFKESQMNCNTDEDLQKIPKLELGDIGKRQEEIPTSVHTEKGISVYQTEMFTNDIVYLSLGFDLSNIPLRLLPYIGILTDILKETGTKSMSYETLAKQIMSVFGGFDFALSLQEKVSERNYFLPVLYIEAKVLKKNIDRASKILADIIGTADLDNEKRINEIIKSRFIYREMHMNSEGFDYSITRIRACVNERGRFIEQVKGLAFYNKYKEIHDASKLRKHIESLKELKDLIFSKKNFHLGVVSDRSGIESAISVLPVINDSLSNEHAESSRIVLPPCSCNEAFITSSDIVFASLGGDFFGDDISYSGKMEVLKNYLSQDYLYDAVRIKGGAYGVWMSLNSRSGFLSMTSYRDPNVRKTYDAYYSIPGHLRKFRMNESAFTNIKIGSYSGFDPLMSPYAKGKKSRDDLMSGVTAEYTERIISEILETNQRDIIGYADHFEEYLKRSFISVIGNSEKITKDRDMFDLITELN